MNKIFFSPIDNNSAQGSMSDFLFFIFALFNTIYTRCIFESKFTVATTRNLSRPSWELGHPVFYSLLHVNNNGYDWVIWGIYENNGNIEFFIFIFENWNT